jgi:hypothetical protein
VIGQVSVVAPIRLRDIAKKRAALHQEVQEGLYLSVASHPATGDFYQKRLPKNAVGTLKLFSEPSDAIHDNLQQAVFDRGMNSLVPVPKDVLDQLAPVLLTVLGKPRLSVPKRGNLLQEILVLAAEARGQTMKAEPVEIRSQGHRTPLPPNATVHPPGPLKQCGVARNKMRPRSRCNAWFGPTTQNSLLNCRAFAICIRFLATCLAAKNRSRRSCQALVLRFDGKAVCVPM